MVITRALMCVYVFLSLQMALPKKTEEDTGFRVRVGGVALFRGVARVAVFLKITEEDIRRFLYVCFSSYCSSLLFCHFFNQFFIQ